jgi:hypothetical protein
VSGIFVGCFDNPHEGMDLAITTERLQTLGDEG